MCKCIIEIGQKIISEQKKRNPLKNYNEDINSFEGTGFQNSAMNFSGDSLYFLYQPFSLEYTFKKVNGDISKPKKETLNIYPTFCMFCGEKIKED